MLGKREIYNSKGLDPFSLRNLCNNQHRRKIRRTGEDEEPKRRKKELMW